MSQLVLFLVEGKSDKVSLEGAIRQILHSKNEPYFMIQSDLTSDNHVCPANVERVLLADVKNELWKRRVELKDCLEIVHLIDTDAAFIKDDALEENPMNYGVTYFTSKIVVQNKARIVDRNLHKRYNIQALLDIDELKGVPYRLFYCSVNLEHVLHNNPNASTIRQKITLSNKFDDEYSDDVIKFLNYMSSPEIMHFKSYAESWEYIKKSENALTRASNIYYAMTSYLDFLNK